MVPGILGDGARAFALAATLARHGMRTLITSQKLSHLQERLAQHEEVGLLTPCSSSSLLENADVLVLGMSFSSAHALASRFPSFAAGRVVVDMTNPWEGDAGTVNRLETGLSCLDLARAIPYVQMAKAFNAIRHDEWSVPPGQLVPIAADDEQAVSAGEELARRAALRPIHIGALALGPMIEAKAFVEAEIESRAGAPTEPYA